MLPWEAEADALSWIHETQGGLVDRGHGDISALYLPNLIKEVYLSTDILILIFVGLDLFYSVPFYD